METNYSAAEVQTARMPFVDTADTKYTFCGKTKDAMQVLEMVVNLQKLTKQLTSQMDFLDEPIAQLEETMKTAQQGIVLRKNLDQMS